MRRFAQAEPRRLADFAGDWTLTRTISQGDGTQAHFEGRARWHWQDHGPEPELAPELAYFETGLLSLPGQPPMQAERRYIWRDGPTVWFDDERFFHAVPPLGGEAHHHCDPDDYRVSYDFSLWPDFSTVWTVRGPRKDYRMHSHFTRLKPA